LYPTSTSIRHYRHLNRRSGKLAELLAMPPKRVRKPLDQDKAFSIAKAAARKLSARGCLSETDRKQVRQANEILLQIRQPYKRRTYQLFLSEVLHKCGSSLFLICAVALGQANIADMRNGERHSLLRELEAQKDLEIFDDEVIRSLASQHVISFQGMFWLKETASTI